MDYEHVIHEPASELSTDPYRRMRQITELLSSNSNYAVGHQRDAVKGIVQSQIRVELMSVKQN